MITLNPGRIYLADQRGIAQTHALQQHCIFNYGNYIGPERDPLGLLHVFNDNVVAAGQQTITGGNKKSLIILIPVTGTLIFGNSHNQPVTVGVGEVFVDHLAEGGSFKITNPYADNWINYFQIQMLQEATNDIPGTFKFDIEARPNRLLDILNSNSFAFKLHIGRFNGREEAVQTLSEAKHFFAIVISGAFEIQGRLMHQRDSIALWDIPAVEMEALSNNAVVLTLAF